MREDGKEKKDPRSVRLMWSLAAYGVFAAAALTWINGFFIAPQAFLVSTTMALIMGLGGYGLLDVRRRRWSWILVLVMLPVGFFLPSPAGENFVVPAIIAVVGLLLAIGASVTGAAAKAAHPDSDDDA